ncbi:MAG: hypothetical protein AB1767_06775 [Bacillota bacterium]
MPALLAAVRHRYPADSLRQCTGRASAWWKERAPNEATAVLYQFYDYDANGSGLYILSAAVPPSLVERTLSGLTALLKGEGQSMVISALPAFRWDRGRNRPAGPLSGSYRGLNAFWTEIGAAVAQARLQAAAVLVNNEL